MSYVVFYTNPRGGTGRGETWARAISGGWGELDYIDCIVHLFMPETREYYYIEQMWEKHEIPIKNSTENEQTRSKK